MHMYPVPLLPEVAQLTVAAGTGTNAVRVAIKSLGWHVTLTCNALKAKGTMRYCGTSECTRRARYGAATAHFGEHALKPILEEPLELESAAGIGAPLMRSDSAEPPRLRYL